MDELRERYKENMRELDKVTGGVLGLTNTNSIFSEILNTNTH